MSLATRLERVRARIEELGVDALLVTTPLNRRWLSGFTGSAGVLLVDAKRARIATDGRYHEQAAREAAGFELVAAPLRSVESFAAELLAGLGGRTVGFEPAHLTFAAHDEWTSAIAGLAAEDRPKLVPAPAAIEPLRAVKEPEEVDALARAVALGDEAFAHAASMIEAGMTERALAWEIQRYAFEHGAEGMAFDTIIAGGPWGAQAHAQPRDVAIEDGEGVVIDMGVVVDGYHSDLTRTVPVGRPSEEFRAVYDLVLAAQETAEERIEVGMTGGQAHEVAATVIAEGGRGDRFTHGLGHGVGLEIHEAPRLAPGSSDVLEDGNVVTVEPGVYVPGWGGVRIEDQCVMEKGRLRVLSRAAKLDLEVG